MNSLKNRVENLESLLLPKPDYRPDIYDFLFEAEQTIGTPPGTSPGEAALEKFGDRETWINDRRIT
jgi:hypothetical protein